MVQEVVNPLNELASLLWDPTNQEWCARARESNAYVKHIDPEQAILMAIETRDAKLSEGTATSHQESL